MVLFSTNVDAVSALLLVMALALENVAHVFRQWLVFRANRQPADLRPLISASTYQEQGKEFTAQAVQRLQGYVQTHPGVIWTVREESELRLRRFSSGGAHFQPP